MKVDYIIVGLGLAGLAFVEELLEAKKTFVVFENNSQTSSLVAGGVYNPVILKRFSPVWNAREQLAVALPFYEKLETKFKTQFDKKFVIKKVFKSVGDQNNWFSAFDKPKVAPFLEATLDTQKYKGVLENYQYGNVKEAGRIDTLHLIETYRSYLKENGWILFEQFKHSEITFNQNAIQYKDIKASKILFAEGFGVKENPYFKDLPLEEVKGESIIIHAPALKIDFILKSTLFVMPLGGEMYKVGATFNHKDKTSNPSEEGKQELVENLKKVIDVPYTIVDQTAGIRPAVKDRRPLVGIHQEYRNLAILNGLGTRGVMIAPTVAKELFNHIEREGELDAETDIKRFL
ncbi:MULTISPECIES: NAD(P)/FAD-dependent oxidoreductase [unclassified Polaribacter]|uniref:NAD(P)/FAD-dependent oxidoreductase n=1 Tax=unclassified Polaribacter TaxID=196858 RepID=UPI0011BE1CD8|nr:MULTISPECIES: FAD-binding oxidoreductase [unclassified Polaribacter]TXD53224.1 FAD-binding oxidoreductase [Polaribacter sp. IC063]TXD61371.1 FAD-binding oxidoreductase [Polaribacter sp. IC066]